MATAQDIEKMLASYMEPLQSSLDLIQETLVVISHKVDHGHEHHGVPKFQLDMGKLMPHTAHLSVWEHGDPPAVDVHLDGGSGTGSKELTCPKDEGPRPRMTSQDSKQFHSVHPEEGESTKEAQKEARLLATGRLDDEDHWIIMEIKNLADRWERRKEPERSGCLSVIVKSSIFENICAAVIVCNSIFVAYTANWEMDHLGSAPEQLMLDMDLFFGIFYSTELILRISHHRFWYFCNCEMHWNLLDFTLVLASVYSLYMDHVMMAGNQGGGEVTSMRILRLLKLAKIGRTLRVMRVFKDLTLIMTSFTQSIVPLFWCFVMLTFVIYIFALVFVQGFAGVLAGVAMGRTPVNNGKEEIEVERIKYYFGNVQSAMLSLYMSVTGGYNWEGFYFLTTQIGPIYAFGFLFFTFFFVFSLFNILTSIFVEKVVVAAEPDRAHIILEQRRKMLKEAKELKHLCHLLDTDGTGTISKEEFMANMENQMMYSYMSAIGLEVRDIHLFFDMVASAANEEEVEIDKFVDGCMSMKGAASSVDMQRQLYIVQSLVAKIGSMEEDLEQRTLSTNKLLTQIMTQMARMGPAMVKQRKELEEVRVEGLGEMPYNLMTSSENDSSPTRSPVVPHTQPASASAASGAAQKSHDSMGPIQTAVQTTMSAAQSAMANGTRAKPTEPCVSAAFYGKE